jgi:hypothetical protein
VVVHSMKVKVSHSCMVGFLIAKYLIKRFFKCGSLNVTDVIWSAIILFSPHSTIPPKEIVEGIDNVNSRMFCFDFSRYFDIY